MTKNTTYTKMFKVATAAAVTASAIVAVAPAASAATSFPDVTDKNAHAENIKKIADRGIVQGYQDGTFKPYGTVNRGQAAKIIAGVLGLETDAAKVKNPNFSDLQATNEFYGAIAALVEIGAISGFKDGTYKTYQPITRVQMAKIISEAFKLKDYGVINPFTDAIANTIGDNVKYVNALFAADVTTGTTKTTFSPRANVTRGQIASFVIRAEEAAKAAAESKTITTVVKAVKEGKVETAAGTYEISSALKDFFTNNAAALVNADVEVVIETKNGVSTIVGVKKLGINVANAKIDLAGVKVEELTVGAAGVEIANATANKVVFKQGATARFSGATTVGSVQVPAGQKPEDVITNYNDVKENIGKVEESAPTPPVVTEPSSNQAVEANNALDTLATTLQTAINNNAIAATYGTVAFANDKFTFTFDGDVKSTKLFEIKNDLKSKRAQLEKDVVAFALDNTKLTNTQVSHLKNVKEISVRTSKGTVTHKRSELTGITNNSTFADVLDAIVAEFTMSDIAADLSKLSGLDEATAEVMSVENYLQQHPKNFTVTLTFNDNSTLNYTVELN